MQNTWRYHQKLKAGTLVQLSHTHTHRQIIINFSCLFHVSPRRCFPPKSRHNNCRLIKLSNTNDIKKIILIENLSICNNLLECLILKNWLTCCITGNTAPHKVIDYAWVSTVKMILFLTKKKKRKKNYYYCARLCRSCEVYKLLEERLKTRRCEKIFLMMYNNVFEKIKFAGCVMVAALYPTHHVTHNCAHAPHTRDFHPLPIVLVNVTHVAGS